jgi:adenylate kinase family enzyme
LSSNKIITRDDLILSAILFIKSKNENTIIALDGFDGAGKTEFAQLLTNKIEVAHIDIDSFYLNQSGEKYLEKIKYNRLLNDILSILEEKTIILDGICSLEILNRIKLKPSLHIYFIKTRYGSCSKNKYIDYSKNVDDIIITDLRDQANFNKMFSKMEKKGNTAIVPSESLTHEIIRYHHKWKPDLAADLQFEWECLK